MIDNDSKQEILREISAIRALLTRLQPVPSADGGKNNDNNNRDAGMDTDAGKRVMVLF